MAVYTPKNNKDVEAIKLPLNYTRSDLEAVSRWLARHSPNTTFVGEGRPNGSFRLVLRGIFSSLVVEPSSYISIDPATTQLTLTSAEKFEEEFDPKLGAGLIVDGSIDGRTMGGTSINLPPNSMFGFR